MEKDLKVVWSSDNDLKYCSKCKEVKTSGRDENNEPCCIICYNNHYGATKLNPDK